MALGLSVQTQPLKGIYVSSSLLSLYLLRIPLWTLRNALPAWRPRRSWPLSRCIRVNLARYLNALAARVGGLGHTPSHRALELGKGVQGVYVDPVPSALVTGELKTWADVASVEPVRVPGYWQHASGTDIVMGAQPAEGEKVPYHFHGGGYVALSAHPSASTSSIPRALFAAAAADSSTPALRRSFAIEYRLAAPNANPFPAQLLDALAGYLYLVHTVGFSPAQIVLVGDSAGANLALALTRYLVSHSASKVEAGAGAGAGLPPPPGALILLSPWVDLGATHVLPNSSYATNAHSDFIPPPPAPSSGRLDPSAALLVGPHGRAFLDSVYVSPASLRLKSNAEGEEGGGERVSFASFPRTFVSLGGAETLVDSIHTLVERMRADIGEGPREGVTVRVERDAIHDFVSFEWYVPERREAARAIVEWVRG
ncbi:hypothetical protein M0805_005555 [Coniferiporia weirii]|nr:hypothetical protein M0805_005555 [Coniferiporia weirii]